MRRKDVPTWHGAPEPKWPAPQASGWLRVALRGSALGTVVFGGLGVLLLVRIVERPFHGRRRPWTPGITRRVCQAALAILGIRHVVEGAPADGRHVIVANHASWLDIFALNATTRLYFVSKAEVAGWPGIGWLARATGTVFVRRDPREARQQAGLLAERIALGHRLALFPEGTSTDGRRVLPFKPALFAAVLAASDEAGLTVQPISLVYHAPDGERADFYGWWGEMDYGAHLVAMLAAPRHGRVEVLRHPPIAVAEFSERKALARAAETAVRQGLEARLS